jgi:hypothetical protein
MRFEVFTVVNMKNTVFSDVAWWKVTDVLLLPFS